MHYDGDNDVVFSNLYGFISNDWIWSTLFNLLIKILAFIWWFGLRPKTRSCTKIVVSNCLIFCYFLFVVIKMSTLNSHFLFTPFSTCKQSPTHLYARHLLPTPSGKTNVYKTCQFNVMSAISTKQNDVHVHPSLKICSSPPPRGLFGVVVVGLTACVLRFLRLWYTFSAVLCLDQSSNRGSIFQVTHPPHFVYIPRLHRFVRRIKLSLLYSPKKSRQNQQKWHPNRWCESPTKRPANTSRCEAMYPSRR